MSGAAPVATHDCSAAAANAAAPFSFGASGAVADQWRPLSVVVKTRGSVPASEFTATATTPDDPKNRGGPRTTFWTEIDPTRPGSRASDQVRPPSRLTSRTGRPTGPASPRVPAPNEASGPSPLPAPRD